MGDSVKLTEAERDRAIRWRVRLMEQLLPRFDRAYDLEVTMELVATAIEEAYCEGIDDVARVFAALGDKPITASRAHKAVTDMAALNRKPSRAALTKDRPDAR